MEAASKATRCIALNNPGCIEQGENFRGLASDQPDWRFAKFKKPLYGIRAMAVTIRTYAKVWNKHTIRSIVVRYAPSPENDTIRYAEGVQQYSGYSMHKKLDLNDAHVLARVVTAIIHMENGSVPYSESVIYTACLSAIHT